MTDPIYVVGDRDILPSDAPWTELRILGFGQGDGVPGDPLFRRCTLPAGWRYDGGGDRRPHVVDGRGIPRVSIFYKAALYDRCAQASIAHPGNVFASEAIYGDGEARLPAEWPVLTSGERADFLATVSRYLADVERNPAVYGERAEKARVLRALATAT